MAAVHDHDRWGGHPIRAHPVPEPDATALILTHGWAGWIADEMEAFLTLAEELHFNRTADRLRLAQPRVSRLIASLERRGVVRVRRLVGWFADGEQMLVVPAVSR